MKLDIDLIKRGSQAELVLSGRLDSNTVEASSKIFLNIAERYDEVILNMKDVEYVSSAGLRLLKQVFMVLRNKGGSFKLKSVSKPVMEVFELTGFSGLFEFV